MPRRGRELWYALAAIAGVTALYAFACRAGGRPARGLQPHRPRHRRRRIRPHAAHGDALLPAQAAHGRPLGQHGVVAQRSTWSPASWARTWCCCTQRCTSTGLAGLTTVLMVVVVVSGLVGRYIYTRLPRTASGGAPARRQALATWHLVHLPLTWALFARRLRPRRRRRSTTRPCSAETMRVRTVRETGLREGPPRLRLGHRHRRGGRPARRRARVDPGRRAGAVQPRPAERTGRRQAARRRDQPRRAGERLRRLSPGAVGRAHHGRRLPRLPHEACVPRCAPARASTARCPGAGGSPACDGCHPDHRGAGRGAHRARPRRASPTTSPASRCAATRRRPRATGFVCADCHPEDTLDLRPGRLRALPPRCRRGLHEAPRGDLRQGLPALSRRQRRDGADFDHSAVPFKLTGKHADVPVRRLPHRGALAPGHREHAAGLLLLPRRRTTSTTAPTAGAARTATPRTTGTRSRSTTTCSRSTTAARSASPPARPATRPARRATPATGATSTPRPTCAASTRVRASPSWPTASAATPAGARPRATEDAPSAPPAS